MTGGASPPGQKDSMEEGQINNLGSGVIPIVAIVGRPNVGKSTLFNRLCRDRRAIVDDTPGITRDRLIAQVTWGDRLFCLVDTGGIEEGTDQHPLWMQVRQHESRGASGDSHR